MISFMLLNWSSTQKICESCSLIFSKMFQHTLIQFRVLAVHLKHSCKWFSHVYYTLNPLAWQWTHHHSLMCFYSTAIDAEWNSFRQGIHCWYQGSGQWSCIAQCHVIFNLLLCLKMLTNQVCEWNSNSHFFSAKTSIVWRDNMCDLKLLAETLNT